jgi:hypothetical protein
LLSYLTACSNKELKADVKKDVFNQIAISSSGKFPFEIINKT